MSLGELGVLPKLSFSYELAIESWRIEVVEAQVRTQFLWFADVPIEVVPYVIFDLINRNIFSCPMMCI